MSRTRQTLEECDNPSCDHAEIVFAGEEGATGYHFGKGYFILGGGGPIPAFYAHDDSCILPALQHVMSQQ